jgi:hypothetical protein
LIGFQLELDPLVLVERGHPGCLHGSDMDKAVGPAAIGLDEAKALVGVEKLYGPTGMMRSFHEAQ